MACSRWRPPSRTVRAASVTEGLGSAPPPAASTRARTCPGRSRGASGWNGPATDGAMGSTERSDRCRRMRASNLFPSKHPVKSRSESPIRFAVTRRAGPFRSRRRRLRLAIVRRSVTRSPPGSRAPRPRTRARCPRSRSSLPATPLQCRLLKSPDPERKMSQAFDPLPYNAPAARRPRGAREDDGAGRRTRIGFASGFRASAGRRRDASCGDPFGTRGARDVVLPARCRMPLSGDERTQVGAACGGGPRSSAQHRDAGCMTHPVG